ncbi:MAG: SDR family NAD(P)-dependent oxidoreductase [Terrimicrobiaceae bacterium]|nr:SDR family NAD(P)-dependent oxidoreductase [Terrimicrobiaceae bacterium]
MKTIFITGATRGIGLAAARGLQDRGAKVIIGSRDPERGAATADREGFESVAIDLKDAESIGRAADAIGARHGRLDVLINNSAILLDHYSGLLDLEPDVLSETLDVNLMGTFRVIRAFVPLLEKSADPRVVNVSSGAGQLDGEPQPWAPAYSISKTALNMLTQQLTAALPRFAVNSMCPGWCRTEMGGPDAPRTAEEGADTIVWLALDAPSALRGQFVKDREPIPW